MEMIYHQKYYLLINGPVFEKAEAYRKEYIRKSEEMFAYIESIGGNAYALDFNGCLSSVRFPSSAPEGFRKKDANGLRQPFKKSKWADDFKKYCVPDVVKWMQEILYCPVYLNYKADKMEGSSCIGNPWHPIGVYWYQNKGPLLLIIPDVQYHIKHLLNEYPGVEIRDGADKWSFPDCMPMEILKEEWDLMAAKYKQPREEA